MAGVCGQCGVSASVMKRCSRCMGILYCSRDCQGKHWPSHKLHCENCNSVQAHHESMGTAELQNIKECSRAENHISQPESYIMIRIKHKLMKHELKIPKSTNGEESFGFVCNQLKIPPTNLRLVSRGKLISKENILSFLENGAVFQAFGEEAEDETGLDMRDIDVLMAQLSVDRNVAVRALRKTGDLVDAILYVSDNM